jgi:hypothetical protein
LTEILIITYNQPVPLLALRVNGGCRSKFIPG